MSQEVKDSTLSFSSKTEECIYWKGKAQEHLENYMELKAEYDEYVANGKAVEMELESLLDQELKKNNILQHHYDKLTKENEMLKEKFEPLARGTTKQIAQLQEELEILREERNGLRSQTRDLEICKDDLENFKRAALQSIEDFEQKLNLAIERNAFLENELDEKETLQVSVQRLKDEARDLRLELNVRQIKSTTPAVVVERPHHQHTRHHQPALARAATICTETTPSTRHVSSVPSTPTNRGHDQNPRLTNGQPSTPNLPPSARVSALNIVGDLLRKVGALESKLASCRSVRDPPPTTTTATSPIREARPPLTPAKPASAATAASKPSILPKTASSTLTRPSFIPVGRPD